MCRCLNLPGKIHSIVAASHVLLLYCRELGIEPTADTYTVLMCDLAEKGDITGIEKVGDSVLVVCVEITCIFCGLWKTRIENHCKSEYIVQARAKLVILSDVLILIK